MNQTSINWLNKTFVIYLIILLNLVALLSAKTATAQASLFENSSTVFFSNDDDYLPVDQAFRLSHQQQGNNIVINIDIAPDYYLYQKQFRFTGSGVKLTNIALPEGLAHHDDYFGEQQIYRHKVSIGVQITDVQLNASIKVRYQGCADKGLCYPPETKTLAIFPVATPRTAQADIFSALNQQKSEQATPAQNTKVFAKKVTTSVQAPISEQFKLAEMLNQDDLWLTLGAFFVGGLLLAFTPCVFPMYPILTSIIVGQKQLSTKRAAYLSFVYVQGMALTYSVLGIVVALAGAQFQAMFQHPAVLVLLSVVFVVLALAMFGVFNLALPSSWQQKLNQLSNSQKAGSTWGALLMGAISGLVASPCTTAPLTGALLYISQTGDIALGAFALYALSLGMGLPLLILGSSGGKLLPKAGPWMNIVKNSFGLLLLAVPIFLLERFINALVTDILWGLLLLTTGGYFYSLNHKLSSSTTAKQNFWFGLRSVVIFVILFSGAVTLFQAVQPSLKPAGTAQYNQHFTRVADLAELRSVIAKANADNKTVMVDLYADWCVACKEFEQYTFTDSKVQQALAGSQLLQVDLTDTGSEENVELMAALKVYGLPSILFFDKTGKELTQQRVTGFMNAKDFASHINNTFAQH